MPVDRLASKKHQKLSLVDGKRCWRRIEPTPSSQPLLTETKSVSSQAVGPRGWTKIQGIVVRSDPAGKPALLRRTHSRNLKCSWGRNDPRIFGSRRDSRGALDVSVVFFPNKVGGVAVANDGDLGAPDCSVCRCPRQRRHASSRSRSSTARRSSKAAAHRAVRTTA